MHGHLEESTAGDNLDDKQANMIDDYEHEADVYEHDEELNDKIYK